MPTHHRRHSDSRAQPNLQYERVPGVGRDSHINRRPVRGSMPPPPIPIDPALDSFSTSTVSLSPGIGLDHLLQSPAGIHERLSYPGGSNNLESFPQNVQLPSMRPTTDLDPNPLCRFYYESGQSGPWTSQRIAGDMNQSNILSGYPSSYARLNHPLILPSQYRESPRSDIGSSTTGRNQPDSGYGTRSITTKSVRSTDYIDQGQSCQSLSGDVGDLQIYPEDHFPGNVSLPTQDANYFDIPNDIPTNLPEDQPAVPLICDYPECKNYESKNQSEHKKHLLRHTKPYQCTVPNCSRKDGFSTNNDLERHKKCLHKITPKNTTDKTFRCASTNCPKKDKAWPRLDNFRQHCIRMHPGESTDDLVKNSVLHSGSSLHSDSASGDSGTRMQRVNNGETGFTNLSTLSLKAPAFDAKVDFSEPNGALNQIAEDVQLQSDEALSQNATLHRSSLLSVSSSNEKCKSQIQMPLLKPNDALHQISELKSFTPSCSSLSDKSSLSKFDSLLNEQTAKFLNIQTNQRYIRDKPAALNMKAEIASQALASDVVNRLSTGSIEEIQLLIKNRLINFFGADRKRKRSPESSPLDEGSDMKRNRVTCEICTKTMGRQCDLKKHKKRHTKPYGCTFTSCRKVFGSKNDWKRHENTQHYQIEAWRCHELTPNSSKRCTKVFYRRELFQSHLKDHHGIKDEEHIRDQSKRQRIGRNGQSGFWCGFCQKVVRLEKHDLEAWDERFNHIDNCHFKQGERIDKWYPLDKDIPKGLLRNEHVLDSGAPSTVPEQFESDSDSTDSTKRSDAPGQTQRASPLSAMPRQNSPSDRATPCASKDSVHVQTWNCCSCQNSIQSVLLDEFCTGCHHKKCIACTREISQQGFRKSCKN